MFQRKLNHKKQLKRQLFSPRHLQQLTLNRNQPLNYQLIYTQLHRNHLNNSSLMLKATLENPLKLQSKLLWPQFRSITKPKNSNPKKNKPLDKLKLSCKCILKIKLNWKPSNIKKNQIDLKQRRDISRRKSASRIRGLLRRSSILIVQVSEKLYEISK